MSQAEDDELTRKRILMQVVKWKALTMTFNDYIGQVNSSAATYEDCEKALSLLSKQIMATDIWFSKQEAMKLALKMDQKDIHQKRNSQEEAIVQVKQDIEHRKKELEEAKIVRQNLEEYKNLHTQIMSHQSRGATMQQCRELEADIQNLELESSALDLLADKKRKQFALLYNCFEDLVEEEKVEPFVAEEQVEPEGREDEMDID